MCTYKPKSVKYVAPPCMAVSEKEDIDGYSMIYPTNGHLNRENHGSTGEIWGYGRRPTFKDLHVVGSGGIMIITPGLNKINLVCCGCSCCILCVSWRFQTPCENP